MSGYFYINDTAPGVLEEPASSMDEEWCEKQKWLCL